MIENLKMATKYSFHVRPRPTEQKASGRADLNGNELDESTFKGPTIIIPTKGCKSTANINIFSCFIVINDKNH